MAVPFRPEEEEPEEQLQRLIELFGELVRLLTAVLENASPPRLPANRSEFRKGASCIPRGYLTNFRAYPYYAHCPVFLTFPLPCGCTLIFMSSFARVAALLLAFLILSTVARVTRGNNM